VVYQKDLGTNSGVLAQTMKVYNPGIGWQKADDQEWQTAAARK
jgi:hypothetical protein